MAANGPGDLLGQQLARLPDAFQAMQDKAVAAAEYRAEQLVTTHLSDRHRVEHLFVTMDGGGTVVPTGAKGHLALRWSYEIVGWVLLAQTSGNMVVDLRTAAAYDTHLTLTSICASAKPTLAGASRASSLLAPMTGWTTLLQAGQSLQPFVESSAAVTLATLTLLLRPV